MKFKHAIFLSFSLICFSAYAESDIQIVQARSYHGDEVEDVKNGETWMAIIKSNGTYTAQPVTITVKAVKDEIVGDPEKGPFTGKEIISHPDYQDAEFLIKGMTLKAGRPIASPVIDGTSLAKGKTIKIKGSKGTVTLVRKDGIHLKRDGYETHDAYQLIGKVGNKEFPLTLPADSTNESPYLNWAGDLNQDGYPDFLLEMSDHYNVTHPTLFLSKVSKSGVSYDKVAERYSVGC